MTDENSKIKGEETPPKNESGVSEENYSSILADALKKKNEEIEALKKSSAENTRRLTEMIVNEQKPQEEQQKVVHTDQEISELRKKAFSEDGVNMDIAQSIVELYEANAERGINPAVPTGVKIVPEYNDYYRSEQTIECLKECLKVADGDKDIFQRELMRLMKK